MTILKRSCCLLIILLVVGNAIAVEIDGTVVDATDTTANIQSTSEVIPNVGDPVQIYFSVAGLKAKAPAATGKVREINGKTIAVAIEKKNAKVVAGLNASIQCSPPRLLVCTLSRDNNPELVLIRDDGIEMKRLTKKEGRDVYAAWSPDGTKIVFFSGDENGRGLFVMDAAGGNEKRLTYGRDEGAAWSPDGKTIVFTHYLSADITQILAITFDETGISKPTAEGTKPQTPKFTLRKLTDGKAYEGDPAWSPDGKTIAFASARSGGWRLYLMDPDGKNVRELSQSDNEFGNVWPAWSPDGRRIAYADSAPDDTLQIFLIDADGKNKKQLTKDRAFNTYVAWSPDGQRLAYMSYAENDKKGSLVLMNADGTHAKIICRNQGAGNNGRPAWKPK